MITELYKLKLVINSKSYMLNGRIDFKIKNNDEIY